MRAVEKGNNSIVKIIGGVVVLIGVILVVYCSLCDSTPPPEDPGFLGVCPEVRTPGSLAIGCDCAMSANCESGFCAEYPRGRAFCMPTNGTPMPNVSWTDADGRTKSLYDLANQGKPVVVEVVVDWCPGCNDLASWLYSGQTDVQSRAWWSPEYNSVRDKLRSGDVLWATILVEGAKGSEAVTQADVDGWYARHPDDYVLLLGDTPDRELYNWVKPSGYPTAFLVDENMQMINFSSRGCKDVLQMVGTGNYNLTAIPQGL